MDKFSKAFEIVDRMVKMGENLPKEDTKKGMGVIAVVVMFVVAASNIKDIVG